MRIDNRLSTASPSLSVVTTRNPAKPRIHVQSRRDPTGPPLLFAHQEKMTPDGPVHVGSPNGIHAEARRRVADDRNASPAEHVAARGHAHREGSRAVVER